MRLCEKYSLRFIVIADRFDTETIEREEEKGRKRDMKAKDKLNGKLNKLTFSARTVDEIKDRYYSLAKAVLELRGNLEHPIVKKPFNYE
jgi:hypothetical protein